MWKQPSETLKYLKGLDSSDRLSKLYSLSRAWETAFFKPDYQASSTWSDLLVFCSSSEKLLKIHFPDEMENKNPDFFLATFGYFFHHKIFFDYLKCDLDGIAKLLNDEILDKKIKFPHRFGKDLYNKYNATHPNPSQYINHSDSLELLSDTPDGIYHCGHYLLGPLGNIFTKEHRSVYPSLVLPLWHCDSVSCNKTHFASFIPSKDTAVVDYYSKIEQVLQGSLGGRTDWHQSLVNLERSEVIIRRDYAFLLETICDTITGNELNALTCHALNGAHKNYLRNILKQCESTSSLERNRAELIAEKLGSNEKLHLLLCLEDTVLIEYIDTLIANKEIIVPTSEVRTPKFVSSNKNNNFPCQISSLGIRSKMPVPMMHLVSLILSGYEKNGLETELEWKLREFSGLSKKDALVSYIQTKGPEQAVTNLVLTSSALTKHICTSVKLSQNLVHESSKISIDRLMWKIGYTPAQYDDLLERLLKRLSQFEDQLTELDKIRTEDDRDRIRSSGVNLFVSLEEFLDKFIAYNTWLLAYDHYGEGKFKFDIAKARTCVSEILTTDAQPKWSPNGDNALGVLLHYLSLLVSWVDELPAKHRENIKRPDGSIPKFLYQDLIPFPFRHTQAWADYDLNQLDIYKDELDNIANQINKSKLAEVRNGIDHFRDEGSFPSLDTMTACALRLKRAIVKSDSTRFFPKHYLLKTTLKNDFDIFVFTYCDYKKRQHMIYGPNLVTGLPNRNTQKSIIIPPCNLLGSPNSTMIFTLHEPSEYSKYWEGYPIKKTVIE